MDSLPTEMIVNILSQLKNNKDIISFSRTSKTNKKICDEHGYVRHMRFDSCFTLKEYERYLVHKNSLHILELKNISWDEYKLWFSDNKIPKIEIYYHGETKLVYN